MKLFIFLLMLVYAVYGDYIIVDGVNTNIIIESRTYYNQYLNSLEELTKKVSKLMKKGYIPVGGIYFDRVGTGSQTYYYQAMYKPYSGTNK